MYVDYIGSIEVRWIGTSPGNRVDFTATSEEHSLNELMTFIDFKPTKGWNKGDKFGNSGVYSFSAVFYEKDAKKTGEVEDKLNDLIDFLLLRKDMIKALEEVADLEIRIGYFGYKDEMWGFHFNKEIIKKISMLNVDIDIDLYASGPDLPDEY